MKKLTLYYSTICSITALTTSTACGYYTAYKINQASGLAPTYVPIKLTDILPNSRSGSFKANICSIIDKYKKHIDQYLHVIQDNRSIFNEESCNWYIKRLKEFLKHNQESFKNGLLLSLPNCIRYEETIIRPKVLSPETDPMATRQVTESNNAFIPYCYKLANVLLSHAFNESILQGKIHIKKAQKQYDEIRCSIRALYSDGFINSYKPILAKLRKIVLSSGGQGSSDINHMNELSRTYFKSIDHKTRSIQQIISSLSFDRNPDLKNEVTKVTNILCSIISMYGVTKILLDFGSIASCIRAKLENANKMHQTFTEQDSWIRSQLDKYIVYLIKIVLLGDRSAKTAMDKCIEGHSRGIQAILAHPPHTEILLIIK